MPIAPDSEDLTIKTGGKILGGWTRVRVTRGVELLPSHFECELTERFPLANEVVVEPRATCTVFLGKTLVMTGYIDRYMVSYDKGEHQVRIAGPIEAEDVVDSSVNVDHVGWTMMGGTTIGQAATKICEPYGIKVLTPNGDKPLPIAFAIYPGYTGYATLEEMARSVGMLLWDDAEGNLVISDGGTGGRAGSAIVEGVNAERVDSVQTADQRFARYMVFGQAPVLTPPDPLDPSPSNTATAHVNVLKQAWDPEYQKLGGRVKMILQEIPDDNFEFSERRARWEANRRYGRSKLVHVTVTGWRDQNGKLWTPNMTAMVKLPMAKIANEERVISEVTWQRGEEGTQTILTLMPKVGLEVQPFAGVVFPTNP